MGLSHVHLDVLYIRMNIMYPVHMWCVGVGCKDNISRLPSSNNQLKYKSYFIERLAAMKKVKSINIKKNISRLTFTWTLSCRVAVAYTCNFTPFVYLLQLDKKRSRRSWHLRESVKRLLPANGSSLETHFSMVSLQILFSNIDDGCSKFTLNRIQLPNLFVFIL